MRCSRTMINVSITSTKRSSVGSDYTRGRSSYALVPQHRGNPCALLTHIHYLQNGRVSSSEITQPKSIGSGPSSVSTMSCVNAAQQNDSFSPQSNGSSRNSVKRCSATASHKEIVAAAETFVKDVMKDWDSSHDWWHAERVRQVAVSLAVEEGLTEESRDLVELAALLHDVGDHKYVKTGSAGPEAIAAFLTAQNYPKEKTQTIMTIITRMGFKEELGGEMSKGIFPELAVVQDADRLDAIGAIGTARCLTYGGSRNRVLHNPEWPFRENLSKDAYQNDNTTSTTIHHFYEKLLKLKDLMKTQAGKERAAKRHAFMVLFLETFYEEWRGEA